MVEPGIIPTVNVNCAQIQEDALALLSSELSDEQERQVFIHLAACASCREEFRRDRMMMRMLHACPTITASPDFDDKLAQRLMNEENQNSVKTHLAATNSKSKTTANPANQPPKGSKPKQSRKKPE